jgi:hypothetical protein
MQGAAPSREELLALVKAYHHERETHRRTAAGTHARVAAAARMRDLDAAFERHLRAWTVDERLRRGWRDALHHGGPPPLRPEPAPRLLFRGVSDANSDAQVRRGPDGRTELYVDGALVRRAIPLTVTRREGRSWFEVEPGLVFEERFAVSPAAMAALRAWVQDPRGEPPWRYAVELAAEGLLDEHLAVTERGRRAVATRELAPA